MTPFSGSHIAVANAPTDALYRIPEGTSQVDASAAVVAQVGYNAANRLVMKPDDWVVVYGDGIVGQCAAQASRARGARVIMIGHRAERLDLARQHSAEAVINNKQEDVVQVVHACTDRMPITGVLDTVQTEESQREYIMLLKRGRGQIVYSGFTPGKSWADMGLLQQMELTTHFVSGWSRERLEATMNLMAEGRIRIEPLVTHLVPYWRGPEIYRMIRDRSEPFLGVTFDWREVKP